MSGEPADPPSYPCAADLREQLGVSADIWERASQRAAHLGVPVQKELIADGVISERAFVRTVAALMGVRCLPGITAEGLVITEDQCIEGLGRQAGLPAVPAIDRGGRCVMLMAPGEVETERLFAFMSSHPWLRSDVCFVTAESLRRALVLRAKRAMLRRAIAGLREGLPHLSAYLVMTGRQGVVLGFVLACALQCVFAWPLAVLVGLYVLMFTCCLMCTLLRFVAVARGRDQEIDVVGEAERPEDVPVYTVLVALYREAEVVPQLLTALGRLVWPRSRLEIKLVCEEDDHETLNAIRSVELRSHVQVVEVPASLPRTKPKALTYALQQSTGDFVVIYDAEDRPHPYQLIEAWRRFRRSDGRLACLQAPLVITNGRGCWLTRMFAFEYAALFSVMLPWLGKHRLVMPLGGTSNHFRRHALEASGAWDPFNVTEDADLGIRLCRMGYRAGTIQSPTFEDAPTRLAVWLPQRTRWFKGWLQTWLVHMRHPLTLYRDVGLASFLFIQVFVPCTFVAVMSNVFLLPTLLVTAGWVAVADEVSAIQRNLLILNMLNLVLGYAGFLLAGWRGLPQQERKGFWRYALHTPGYWLMLSLATWRAAWQLYRRPFLWEKTPHTPKRHEPAIGHA